MRKTMLLLLAFSLFTSLQAAEIVDLAPRTSPLILCETDGCQEVIDTMISVEGIYPLIDLLGVCDRLTDCAKHADDECFRRYATKAKSATLTADSASDTGEACMYTCESLSGVQLSFKAICKYVPKDPPTAGIGDGPDPVDQRSNRKKLSVVLDDGAPF